MTDGELSQPCSRCGGSQFVPVAKHGFDYDFGYCPDCYVAPSVEERLKAAGIVRPTNFETWVQRPELQEAYEACQAVISGSRWCVFMRGGAGVGKTHLAKATATTFVEGNRTVFFRKVPRLLDEMRSTYDKAQRTPDHEDRALVERSLTGMLDWMATVNLLILDDLGVQSMTPWASEKLYTIIDDRYEARQPLIVTTNVETANEREHQRTIDRLSSGLVRISKRAASQRGVYDR